MLPAFVPYTSVFLMDKGRRRVSKKWKIIFAAILLFLAYLCFYKPRTVEGAMKSDPSVRGYVMEFHDDHILVGVLPDDDLYETYPVLWVSRNTELYGGRTTFFEEDGISVYYDGMITEGVPPRIDHPSVLILTKNHGHWTPPIPPDK